MSEIESANSPPRHPIEIPVVGKVFNSEEELRTYYREYAYNVGFGVTKISNRKKNGLQYFSLACSRYGSYVSSSAKPRPTTAINCPAKVNVKVSREGQYEISKVVVDHNHDLSPNKSRRFRSNKIIDLHAKRTLEMNDVAGLRTNKTFNTLTKETDEHDNISFGEMEARTCIRRTQRELGADADDLQQYFSQMVKKNSDFYYHMDTNEESRLKNIFWADARCRAAYASFHDIITFDSTYITDKYDIPFAPLIGVNHHGQSILLGCALLSNEDTSTYIWLFKTWLDCMSGVAPGGIVTNQCATMKEAISVVFPNTHHRLCLLHTMQKIYDKLNAYSEYRVIKKTLKNLVYESQHEVEFERAWQEMIEKFSLQTNNLLTSFYEIKKSWVPVYLKKYFWAGISTTQRSESMNAFFDGYMNSKTSLNQFMIAYDNALRNEAEKENQADFMCFHKNLPLVTDMNMEKQFAAVYTHEILRKFQSELKGLVYCNVREVNSSTYEVTDSLVGKDNRRKHKIFVVGIIDNTLECECSLFNFSGIVCRHIVATLNYQGVDEIDNRYICLRWRKDVKRRHTLIAPSYDDATQTPKMWKYDRLTMMTRVGNELAATTNDVEKYNWWKDHITKGIQKLTSWTTEVNCKSSCDDGMSDSTRRKRGRPLADSEDFDGSD